MAPPRDLRAWIALLEREGELDRISAEVDPHLEITEINDRTVKAGGPALLFENVKGSEHPLLINQFGTERRMCLALRRRASTTSARGSATCSRCSRRRASSRRCKGLAEAEVDRGLACRRASAAGRAQEVVLTGDDVDLGALPIQTCWPGDAAPFITLPAVITRDPRDGTRNVGMYRMQVLDRRTTAMHWQIHKDGRADYLATDGRLEVAVALGLDPVTAYAASAPLPKHIDEFMLAGFLTGEPVELVQGKTVDLEVPANAEIVLEGYVEQRRPATEGPFGDHTGYYTPRRAVPGLPRHRDDDAARRDLPVDRRRQAAAGGRLARQGDRADLPARDPDERAGDRRLRPAGRGRVPQLRHRLDPQGASPATRRRSCTRSGASGCSASRRRSSSSTSAWTSTTTRRCSSASARTSTRSATSLLTEGPLDHLDHAPTRQFFGGKIGIDATHKGPTRARGRGRRRSR